MTLNGRSAGGTSGDAERDARLDRLYREAGGEMPPARLDAAILAAAHHEVSARPRPLSSTLRRWRVPISIAALVVLSVSLVTLVQEEGGDRLTDIPPVTPPPALEQKASPPAPAAMAEAGRQEPQPQAAAVAPAPPPAAASQSQMGVQTLPDLLAKPVPAPTARARDDATVGVRGMAAESPSSSLEARRLAAQASQAPASPVTAKEAAGRVMSSAPPAPVQPAAKPVPKATASDQGRSVEAGGGAVLQRPPIWSDLERQPPEKWLERIEELRQASRTAELNDLLAEFRKRFTDQRLPAWVR